MTGAHGRKAARRGGHFPAFRQRPAQPTDTPGLDVIGWGKDSPARQRLASLSDLPDLKAARLRLPKAASLLPRSHPTDRLGIGLAHRGAGLPAHHHLSDTLGLKVARLGATASRQSQPLQPGPSA